LSISGVAAQGGSGGDEAMSVASQAKDIETSLKEGPKSAQECIAAGRLEYTIEAKVGVSSSANSVIIRFPASAQMVPLLTARPVLCLGGVFEIQEDPSGSGVFTELDSSSPEHAAREIALRLANRLSAEGNSLNPCPMQ